MPGQDLATIQPKLTALDSADVRQPDIPMSVYQQEANDLLTWLDKPENVQPLFDVGLPPDVLSDVRVALPGLRHAQSQWIAVWSGRKPSEQKALEDQGQALRDDLFRACRWNLRKNALANQTLDRISDGSGVADLVADLDDLATLVEGNVDSFATDKTFDARTKVAEARALADEVRVGLSEFRTSDAQRDALDTRDRAFTYFHGLFSDVRAAGLHAYRNRDEKSRFQSAYARQKRGRAKAKPG